MTPKPDTLPGSCQLREWSRRQRHWTTAAVPRETARSPVRQSASAIDRLTPLWQKVRVPMTRPLLLLLYLLLSTLPFARAAETAPPQSARPNVLFIAIDDLRDWVGYLGYQQVKTPNLDRLAARGVAFTRGFCASPCCNPSRTALCTGLRPGQTGVYNNSDDWRKIVPAEITTLPLHFKNNGYFVAGAGKIYHESFRRESDWEEFTRTTRSSASGATTAGISGRSSTGASLPSGKRPHGHR